MDRWNYVWGIAQASAFERDLLIYPVATGSRAEHFCTSGHPLTLFAHFALDEHEKTVSTVVPIGESRDIEFLMFTTVQDDVGEGFSWNLEYPRGKVLGKFSITKLLERWSNWNEGPQAVLYPHKNFLHI